MTSEEKLAALKTKAPDIWWRLVEDRLFTTDAQHAAAVDQAYKSKLENDQ